jgi:hypothetical protein
MNAMPAREFPHHKARLFGAEMLKTTRSTNCTLARRGVLGHETTSTVNNSCWIGQE